MCDIGWRDSSGIQLAYFERAVDWYIREGEKKKKKKPALMKCNPEAHSFLIFVTVRLKSWSNRLSVKERVNGFMLIHSKRSPSAGRASPTSVSQQSPPYSCTPTSHIWTCMLPIHQLTRGASPASLRTDTKRPLRPEDERGVLAVNSSTPHLFNTDTEEKRQVTTGGGRN